MKESRFERTAVHPSGRASRPRGADNARSYNAREAANSPRLGAERSLTASRDVFYDEAARCAHRRRREP